MLTHDRVKCKYVCPIPAADFFKEVIKLLDERKRRILAAVVDAYITTGEPVGSKAVAALPDIRVSPATIRNDMAMLEQLG